MIKEILKIRIIQLYRLLSGIGLFRFIFLLSLIFYLLFIAYKLLLEKNNTSWGLIITGLLLFSIHASRKDKNFLKIFTPKVYLIYLIEYLVVTFPVFIIWIISENWRGIFILIFILLFMSFINLSINIQNSGSKFRLLLNPFKSDINLKLNIKIPISSSGFEWISGIRRNFFFIAPSYLFILAFSYRPYVGPIGIIFISILISSFYSFGESREFIEIYASGPKHFLNKKILNNWKYFLMLYIPVLFLTLIFQAQTWYFIAGSLIVSLIIQVIAIILKYALFEENANLNRNGLLVFLNIFFILIPPFWPVPIILGIKYYIKAKDNLKKYFDAYN